MTNIFAHEHLVGTPVHCKVRGNGEVVGLVTEDTIYKVLISFGKGLGSFADSYTGDGKYYAGNPHPTLSFGHRDNYTHDYGTAPEKLIEYPALFELREEMRGAGTVILFTDKTTGTVLITTKELYKVGETRPTWTSCTNSRVWKQLKFSTLDK